MDDVYMINLFLFLLFDMVHVKGGCLTVLSLFVFHRQNNNNMQVKG